LGESHLIFRKMRFGGDKDTSRMRYDEAIKKKRAYIFLIHIKAILLQPQNIQVFKVNTL
jgi:hypothetical protein